MIFTKNQSIRLSSNALPWPNRSECASHLFAFSFLSCPSSRLDREIKTINAWFQNKRASFKKRSRGDRAAPVASSAPVPTIPSSPPISTATTLRQPDSDYEDYVPYPRPPSFAPPIMDVPLYAHHIFDSDAFSHKHRNRPSPEQIRELKRLYDVTQHPTRELRQELGARIGM